ncbi:hypothetical protein, partial [Hallella multisaccharivorax]|uniref:hypothetical protein n=1 Tax=Hallella multisaccharivorax TaxID=310514 RepID=UPI00360EF88B
IIFHNTLNLSGNIQENSNVAKLLIVCSTYFVGGLVGWVGGGVGGPTMTPDPGAVHFTAEAAIQIWDLSIIPPFTSISSRTLSLSSISK